ncbi:MAG: hypothetical protein ACYCZB_18280 [Acidiphilium sp.]
MSTTNVVVLSDEDEVPPVVADDVVADAPEEKLPPGLVAEGDGYALVLLRPLKLQFRSSSGAVREEAFDRLPMRRLTGGDMREMMTSSRQDGAFLLLEKIVGLTPASRVPMVLDKLDAADLVRALAVVGFLSGNSRPTGR